jgi:hypothetical protein
MKSDEPGTMQSKVNPFEATSSVNDNHYVAGKDMCGVVRLPQHNFHCVAASLK